MKKVLAILVVSLFAVSAYAQTEQGKLRIGGSSNLGFMNTKAEGADDSDNNFNLGVNGGYFIMDNLSLNAGLNLAYSKSGEADGVFGYGLEIGARYYLPAKVFFGADFDLFSPGGKNLAGEDIGMGMGVKASVGYAWFVNEKVAIEPAAYYRLGLSDKEEGTQFNRFGVQVGISVYF